MTIQIPNDLVWQVEYTLVASSLGLKKYSPKSYFQDWKDLALHVGVDTLKLGL